MLGPPGDDVGHQEAKLAKLVMTYLALHPRAMDTVAGIMKWWMPEEAMGVDPQMMRRVLDKLREQGKLERVGSAEHVHYRLKNQ